MNTVTAITCPACGSDDLCFGVDEHDAEDGTFVCENCEAEGYVLNGEDGTLSPKVTAWLSAPVIGQRVGIAEAGPTWNSTSHGTYIGVALDEEDGMPYHYFVNGEINMTPQRCFGFPALPNTPTTTDLTPTQLITDGLKGA